MCCVERVAQVVDGKWTWARRMDLGEGGVVSYIEVMDGITYIRTLFTTVTVSLSCSVHSLVL